jgi:polyphosphate kinase
VNEASAQSAVTGAGRETLPFSMPRAVSPRDTSRDADYSDAHLYFNRELSWIDFNWRVLFQAINPDIPLLERVQFLSIAESNLDEFVRKRIGGLKRQLKAGVSKLSPDGRTPAEQLTLIRSAVATMRSTMSTTWLRRLRPQLAEEAGIHIVRHADLIEDERARIAEFFRTSIYPILTPLAVDSGHPFPFISNLSLSLAILLRRERPSSEDDIEFARVKVPATVARWVPADIFGRRLVPLEDVICAHVHELFPGMQVESAHVFRVTRNADLRRDEEEAEDLIEMISEELRERRFAPVVRLEAERAMPQHACELLCRELDIDPDEIIDVDGPLGLSDLSEIARLDMPEHRFGPWEPLVPERLEAGPEEEDRPDVFATIREGDILVHHPYDSFAESVQRFVEAAAGDPDVLAIKQTLYRTSEDSPIMKSLVRAAEAGKQVAVLVEVTARFDERNNIEWGQMLEKSGVHVTYGLVGLKTHTKVTLVVRKEASGIRTYCHIGTGNYHSGTARLYTDLGLLTCDADIASDVINLFHYLTGHAPEQRYRELLVAPEYMRARFNQLIQREIAHSRAGRKAGIVAKMNALDDVEMIEALYLASRAGVSVDLIVRGHCMIRPGLPGFSENIRVVSIVGRFLEHDRIFCFENDGDPAVFIGSADWRRRNLDERVEAVVQVRTPGLVRRIRDVLDAALADNESCWDLGPDGRYSLRRPVPGEPRRGFHRTLMRRATDHWSFVDQSDGGGRTLVFPGR